MHPGNLKELILIAKIMSESEVRTIEYSYKFTRVKNSVAEESTNIIPEERNFWQKREFNIEVWYGREF